MPTIQINGVDYPSYVTVAEADEYLAADAFYGPTWATYAEAAKQAYLITASRIIAMLPWCVDPAPDINAPPDALKHVTIIFAAMIGANPELATPGGPAAASAGEAPIRRAKAGSVEVEYFFPASTSGGPSTPFGFPVGLWNMLKAAELVGCEDADVAVGYLSGGGCGSYFPDDRLLGCARCGCAPGAVCGCNSPYVWAD